MKPGTSLPWVATEETGRPYPAAERVDAPAGVAPAARCFAKLRTWVALSGLLVASAAANAFAQTQPAIETNLSATRTTDRVGAIVLSDQQVTDLAELPQLSQRQRLPVEIKDRIRRFEVRRDAYIKEQAALRKQLNGASTEEERQRIRALIEKQRAELLERAKTLREEVTKRLEVIRERMPAMSEVLDDARRSARDAALTRKRRGQE